MVRIGLEIPRFSAGVQPFLWLLPFEGWAERRWSGIRIYRVPGSSLPSAMGIVYMNLRPAFGSGKSEARFDGRDCLSRFFANEMGACVSGSGATRPRGADPEMIVVF
jgi:hypothetical protein